MSWMIRTANMAADQHINVRVPDEYSADVIVRRRLYIEFQSRANIIKLINN